MQRLQQRAQKAVFQAAQKNARSANESAKKAKFIKREEAKAIARFRTSLILTHRRERKEAWAAGPLKPHRLDLPFDNDNGIAQGLLPSQNLPTELLGPSKQSGKEQAKRRKSAKKKRSTPNKKNGITTLPANQRFKVGDRVCCIATKGPLNEWRGKIGTIVQTSAGHGQRTVHFVEGIGQVDRIQDSDTPEAKEHLPVPPFLLVPVRSMRNPHTGRLEDVLIGLPPNLHEVAKTPLLNPDNPLDPAESDRLARERREFLHKRAEKRKGDSAALREKEAAMPDHEIDTNRYEVEIKSWTPALLSAPMPEGVLDELRGKYSKFRTYHGAEYIKRVEEGERRRLENIQSAKDLKGMLLNPLREASLRDSHLRKSSLEAQAAAEGRHVDMPSSSILEILGRQMVASGAAEAPLQSREERSNSYQDNERMSGQLAVGIAEARQDESLRTIRRQGRVTAQRYWPVKGWRTRGDGRARRDGADGKTDLQDREDEHLDAEREVDPSAPRLTTPKLIETSITLPTNTEQVRL